MRHGSGLAAVVVGLALLAPAGCAKAATPCERLTSLQLPHASVTSAAVVQAGAVSACKVDVVSRPSPDSDIGIEVWIPEGAAWNGIYLQLGNGGFAGRIASERLGALAAKGYAVAMTDDGHQATARFPDASWAIGRPEKVVDFGWRSLKETTEAAKALIRAHAGAPARRSYFQGCSDGGREALMEAQRFPRDFDGIVAGAPAYDFSGLLTLGAYDMQALAAPGAWLSAGKLRALEAAALAACGGGRYIADPAACHFDPGEAACPPGQDHDDCLTPPQVDAAAAIYRGLVVTQGGPRFSYPGYTPGAEAEPGSWATWLTGPSKDQLNRSLIWGFSSGFWRGFVYGDPSEDVLRLDLQMAPVDAARVAAIVNATDPDLSDFRDHGGKLIQFHGWNDPAIPARGSIDYYGLVRRQMGDVSGFYRLYLIPGMLHCGGGPGPGAVDWLAVLRAWVEQGQPPGDITAQTVAAPDGPPGPPTQVLHPYGS
ncbi:MAG TPA: tannase/feruloyl esterase family alpha/beta hydrolase [Caulobacteraceae bacterium]|nr:tannase/feruloyl esterase family alpha/beta hydrolase [Caulobacteraceae bacterium]